MSRHGDSAKALTDSTTFVSKNDLMQRLAATSCHPVFASGSMLPGSANGSQLSPAIAAQARTLLTRMDDTCVAACRNVVAASNFGDQADTAILAYLSAALKLIDTFGELDLAKGTAEFKRALDAGLVAEMTAARWQSLEAHGDEFLGTHAKSAMTASKTGECSRLRTMLEVFSRTPSGYSTVVRNKNPYASKSVPRATSLPSASSLVGYGLDRNSAVALKRMAEATFSQKSEREKEDVCRQYNNACEVYVLWASMIWPGEPYDNLSYTQCRTEALRSELVWDLSNFPQVSTTHIGCATDFFSSYQEGYQYRERRQDTRGSDN